MTNGKKVGLFSLLSISIAGCKYLVLGFILFQLTSGYKFSSPFNGYYPLLGVLAFAVYRLQKSLEDLAISYISIEDIENNDKD
jgi:hypothetical protein